MNILFTSNEKYAPKLVVALSSFLDKHADNYEEITIFIRTNDLSIDARNEIIRLVEQYGFPHEQIVYKDNKSLISKLEQSKVPAFKGNYMVYYKLFDLDKIINHGRLLILDCDILICDNLLDLWNYELEGHVFGAVKEYPTVLNKHGTNYSQEYNTGVLLVDIDKYISEEIENKLFDYVQYMPEDWFTGDQALFSFAMRSVGQVKQLPLKYNFIFAQLSFNAEEFYYLHEITDDYYSREEYDCARDNAAILHLISGNFQVSPWFDNGTMPIKAIWDGYMCRTVWKGYSEGNSANYLVVSALKILNKVLPRKTYIRLLKRCITI